MLRREGYVEQVADGAYVTGAALSRLGSAEGRAQALREKLQQTIDRLRDSVGAAIYLSRYIDGEVHVTQCAESPAAPRSTNGWTSVPPRTPARSARACSASSTTTAAVTTSPATRWPASPRGPSPANGSCCPASTPNAATVPVLDLQEYAIGTVCAAVPITAGSSVGCLALSLPVEHAHRLRRAADTLNRGATPVLLSLAI